MERMTYTAMGVWEGEPPRCRLAYDEPEESGMAGTRTLLDISPERVELSRSGAVRARFVFAPGEDHTSEYETPYGMLTVTIRTGALRTRLKERGGILKLAYDMTLAGIASSRALSLRVDGGEVLS